MQLQWKCVNDNCTWQGDTAPESTTCPRCGAETRPPPGAQLAQPGPPPNPYVVAGLGLGGLLAEKQAAYGNSFGHAGEVLKVLYPRGIRPEQYRDLLTIARVLDKLFRIATRKDAFGESPWRDAAGYCLLALVADEQEAEGGDKTPEEDVTSI